MTQTRSDYDPTRFREVFEGSYTYANGFARNTHRFADRPALREPDTGRSWTYAELGADVDVRRNDAVTLDEVAALAPDGIVISPGPCTPREAGISVPLVQRFTGEIPILGVCLGHQAIGAALATRPSSWATRSRPPNARGSLPWVSASSSSAIASLGRASRFRSRPSIWS